jgi:hypothetical protein
LLFFSSAKAAWGSALREAGPKAKAAACCRPAAALACFDQGLWPHTPPQPTGGRPPTASQGTDAATATVRGGKHRIGSAGRRRRSGPGEDVTRRTSRRPLVLVAMTGTIASAAGCGSAAAGPSLPPRDQTTTPCPCCATLRRRRVRRSAGRDRHGPRLLAPSVSVHRRPVLVYCTV